MNKILSILSLVSLLSCFNLEAASPSFQQATQIVETVVQQINDTNNTDTNYLVVSGDTHFGADGVYVQGAYSFYRIPDGIDGDGWSINSGSIWDATTEGIFTNESGISVPGTYTSIDGNSYTVQVSYGTSLTNASIRTSVMQATKLTVGQFDEGSGDDWHIDSYSEGNRLVITNFGSSQGIEVFNGEFILYNLLAKLNGESISNIQSGSLTFANITPWSVGTFIALGFDTDDGSAVPVWRNLTDIGGGVSPTSPSFLSDVNTNIIEVSGGSYFANGFDGLGVNQLGARQQLYWDANSSSYKGLYDPDVSVLWSEASGEAAWTLFYQGTILYSLAGGVPISSFSNKQQMAATPQGNGYSPYPYIWFSQSNSVTIMDTLQVNPVLEEDSRGNQLGQDSRGYNQAAGNSWRNLITGIGNFITGFWGDDNQSASDNTVKGIGNIVENGSYNDVFGVSNVVKVAGNLGLPSVMNSIHGTGNSIYGGFHNTILGINNHLGSYYYDSEGVLINGVDWNTFGSHNSLFLGDGQGADFYGYNNSFIGGNLNSGMDYGGNYAAVFAWHGPGYFANAITSYGGFRFGNDGGVLHDANWNGVLQANATGNILFAPGNVQSVVATVSGAAQFPSGIKTVEGDTFYPHTVGGNLVWNTTPP